ncbi:MAG: hydrolase Nlp/P60, partial [Bacteroidia bacterium]|nr:hydrolase Nlp/P60 [Bacteroidia bacterium]
MEHGICNLSVVPGRLEPSDSSEMITQLLFGEHFTILRQEEQWVYIRCAYDNYECWIDQKQFQEISPETFQELEVRETTTCLELFYVLEDQDRSQYIPITLGCS